MLKHSKVYTDQIKKIMLYELCAQDFMEKNYLIFEIIVKVLKHEQVSIKVFPVESDSFHLPENDCILFMLKLTQS